MSAADFTPGPWRWWTSNSWRRLTSEARDGTRPDGGVLCPIAQRDGHPDVLVSEADMALIAAAPELYEALDCALDEYEQHKGRILDVASPHWSVAARAALAKARKKVNR